MAESTYDLTIRTEDDEFGVQVVADSFGTGTIRLVFEDDERMFVLTGLSPHHVDRVVELLKRASDFASKFGDKYRFR